MSEASAAPVAAWSATKCPTSPWGKPLTSKPTRVSLLDVMSEEQGAEAEQASLRLAQQLQFEEETGMSYEEATTERGPKPEQQEATTMSDHDLAVLLQAQFDDEHDSVIAQAEHRVNSQNGNVKISLDLFRAPFPQPRVETRELRTGDTDSEEEDQEELLYDPSTKSMRDSTGEIVTKHNASANKSSNGRKLMESLPLSFPSGDTRKGKRGKHVRLSNKVYNQMMTYAVKSEKSRHRIKEKKDTSTSDHALDSKTRLILFRMVNANILDEVNGAISMGKEAIVFHATRHVDPDDMSSDRENVAIKVFKTTITEFKQRQQFLHGDRRYESRVGRLSARKLVVLWAEKEAANLVRMERAGLRCPRVVIQHKHVLVMSFIGDDGVPAPKLKEANLSRKGLIDCFEQVQSAMSILYNKCQLVHADLSEYNLLYHKKNVYFIDVGQSVIPSHPRADEFLYRDCVSICRFFRVAGMTDPAKPDELFKHICGRSISPENASQYMHTLNVSKRAPKRLESLLNENTSSVCVTHQQKAELAQSRTGDAADTDSSNDSDDDLEDAAGVLAAAMWMKVATCAVTEVRNLVD